MVLESICDMNNVQGQVGAGVEYGGAPETISNEIAEREHHTQQTKTTNTDRTIIAKKRLSNRYRILYMFCEAGLVPAVQGGIQCTSMKSQSH